MVLLPQILRRSSGIAGPAPLLGGKGHRDVHGAGRDSMDTAIKKKNSHSYILASGVEGDRINLKTPNLLFENFVPTS